MSLEEVQVIGNSAIHTLYFCTKCQDYFPVDEAVTSVNPIEKETVT